MKLRNKKTGEIGNLLPYGGEDGKIWVWLGNISRPEYRYNSLAELNEEWEDYEAPKEYWFIDFNGEVKEMKLLGFEWQGWMKEIGNYFESEEEAEKAVEKLKAWKRLKEARFEFKKWKHKPLFSYHYGTVKQKDGYKIYIEARSNKLKDYMQDLGLLFGGEE